jgi:Myb-like DNA-binding domain
MPPRGQKRRRNAENADAEEGSAASAAPAAALATIVLPSPSFTHEWNEHRNKDAATRFDTGKWSSDEDALLTAAFEEYCLTHELDESARGELFLNQATAKGHREVWKHLAGYFERRTVRSVLRRSLRLFHPHAHAKMDKWTAEDKAMLAHLVEKHGRVWKLIGEEMKRIPSACEVQYNRIVCPQSGSAPAATPNRGQWKKQEEEALLQALASHARFDEESNAYVAIPWTKVATEVGTRSVSQCISKWGNEGVGLIGKTDAKKAKKGKRAREASPEEAETEEDGAV